MNETQIMQKLTVLFRDFFEDDSLVLSRDTTSADIEDWTSLEHIPLVEAVERAFGVRFQMHEVSTMKSVGDIADRVAARLE